MEIDFNAAFDAGMSKEDIMHMVETQVSQVEAQRKAEEEARKASKEKSELIAEARAYIINGVLAYCEAFDLSEEIDEEDVKMLEQELIKLEAQIPVLIKMLKGLDELGLI